MTTRRPFIPLGGNGRREQEIDAQQVNAVRSHLLSRLDLRSYSPFGADAQQHRRALMAEIRQALESGVLASISRQQITDALVERLYADIFGLGPLEPLIEDENVLEITVTSHDAMTVRDMLTGALRVEPGFEDEAAFRKALQNLVLRLGYTLSPAHPILDLRIPNPPLRLQVNLFGVRGPTFALRRGRTAPFSFERMIEWGTLDERAVAFIEDMLAVPVGMVVAGVPGTGKTTLLEAIIARLATVKRDEVIAVVEDTPEMSGLEAPNIAHTALSVLPESDVGIEDLIAAQLRSNTRVLVVGEIRRQEEAGALLMVSPAMRARFTTLHGETPQRALSRLLMLARGPKSELTGTSRRELMQYIAETFPLVLQTDQLPDGRYILSQIAWLSVEQGEFVLEPVMQARVVERNDALAVEREWREVSPPGDIAARIALHRSHYRRAATQAHIQPKIERARLLVQSGKWLDAAHVLRDIIEDEPQRFDDLATMLETALRNAGLWNDVAAHVAQERQRIEAALQAGDWRDVRRRLEAIYTDPYQRLVMGSAYHDLRGRMETVRRSVEAVEAVLAQAAELAASGEMGAALDLLNRTPITGAPQPLVRKWQEAIRSIEGGKTK